MPLYARLVYENRVSANPDVDDVVHLVGPFDNNEDLMKWYDVLFFETGEVKRIDTVYVDKVDDLLSKGHRLVVENTKFGLPLVV